MNIEQLKTMSHLEINELCAVKVMGWEVRGTSTAYFIGPNEIIRTKDDSSYGNAWNPVEDMNDAMRLVDKLQDTKTADTNARWLNFSFEQMKYGAITYNTFITDEETNKTYEGNGKTAALAISYACLLAVMDS